MHYFYRSKLTGAQNADTRQSSTDIPSMGSEATDSTSATQQSSSKYILSQAKKPSGATTVKSNGSIDTDDGDKNEISRTQGVDHSDITSNENALELRVELKELQMELERREAEAKDLQVTYYFTFVPICRFYI